MAHWRWVGLASVVMAAGCPGNGPEDTSSLAQAGETCSLEHSCVDGYVCAGDATCRVNGAPGTAGLSEACVSSSYCELGLVCSADGLCSAAGAPGTAQAGDTCDQPADCEAGLSCSSAGTCAGYGLPLWDGAACTPAPEGPFRALFQVPGSEPLANFYALPYPNDARVRVDGTLDLAGHPSPGVLVPQLGDVVGDALQTIGASFHGFGANQTIYARFSGPVNFGSVTLGVPGQGTLALIDLTPGTTQGERVQTSWEGYNARGTYICENYVTVRPSRPLTGGHTYALLLSTGLESSDGHSAGRDDDFTAMIAPQAPADARLTAAWQAYAPLRDYLSAGAPFPGTALASAAVFTVGDQSAPARELRDAVWARPQAPALSGLVSCDDGATDYQDAELPGRGCGSVAATYEELQGRVDLPQFQAGTPPFRLREQGGEIPLGTGSLSASRVEDVVFSLTVPRDLAMPDAGWPVVIYAHGTGGDYRSAVREGLAARLADVTLADGTHQGFAVLTIDQVLHGPRRHAESWSADLLAEQPDAYTPEQLVYNPLNPAAARGNQLQAAADGFALVRALRAGVAWDGASSPTGEPLALDADHVYVVAHSQGATAALIFAPYEPDVLGVVVSGAGGLLMESLLHKRDPIDLGAALSVGLADPNLNLEHPLLNLMQQYGEPADPINHALALTGFPAPGFVARDVLQVYGVGDTYTPDAAQANLARAMRLVQVTGAAAPIDQITAVSEPVRANLANGATGVVRVHEPAPGHNGHFVAMEDEAAAAQIAQFLGTAVATGRATLVAK